jgi:alpha-tubulin suppressor-like RCC1 family protein
MEGNHILRALMILEGYLVGYQKKLMKGVGEHGQLGRTLYVDAYNIPEQIPFSFCKKVFCAGFSTFLVTPNGVFAFGKNGFGELGVGDWNPHFNPVRVKALDRVNIVQIAGGLHHTLFLDENGEIWSAGRNSDGQLGLEKVINGINTPIVVAMEEQIVSISSGTSSFHSFAVGASGDLYACGQNQYNQLGLDKDVIYGFQKLDLKGRSCEMIHGGSQYSIVALSSKSDGI